jgi:hypothetical protein
MDEDDGAEPASIETLLKRSDKPYHVLTQIPQVRRVQQILRHAETSET